MIFRWWMAPAIGVGLVAVANGVLIATALRVRPQKVEDHPYAASALEDERAGERAAFVAHGWSLDHRLDGDGVVLTLHTPGTVQPVAGVVRFYRPDDISADRDMPWSDLGKPLRFALPRPGAWAIRVVLRDSAGGTVVDGLRIIRP
jgi:nitrogen fixation protein FixH